MNLLQCSVTILLSLAASLVGAQVSSAPPSVSPATSLQLRSLAATCAACHGTDGRAVPGAGLIGLRGRDRNYLATQLTAFRDGSRPGTVMPQIAKGYSPEQIDQLAAYFAAQP